MYIIYLIHIKFLHQDGSDSVTILPVKERVVRAIVAAPMASPAPVTIGSRCPAQPVDYRTSVTEGC